MGGVGSMCGPSDDGGFEEFEEFWYNRAVSSTTRPSRWATRDSNPAAMAPMFGRKAAWIWTHRSIGRDGGRLMSDNDRR